jgi:hypothetical protein
MPFFLKLDGLSGLSAEKEYCQKCESAPHV